MIIFHYQELYSGLLLVMISLIAFLLQLTFTASVCKDRLLSTSLFDTYEDIQEHFISYLPLSHIAAQVLLT